MNDPTPVFQNTGQTMSWRVSKYIKVFVKVRPEPVDLLKTFLVFPMILIFKWPEKFDLLFQQIIVYRNRYVWKTPDKFSIIVCQSKKTLYLLEKYYAEFWTRGQTKHWRYVRKNFLYVKYVKCHFKFYMIIALPTSTIDACWSNHDWFLCLFFLQCLYLRDLLLADRPNFLPNNIMFDCSICVPKISVPSHPTSQYNASIFVREIIFLNSLSLWVLKICLTERFRSGCLERLLDVWS